MKLPANGKDQHIPDHDDGEAPNDLAVIRAQTSESLQILRNLLALLMPQTDDGGPKLEDLIAALVAQQRDIQAGIARLQSDMNALFDRLDRSSGAENQRGLPG
jgi:signal transduction histidine kinase